MVQKLDINYIIKKLYCIVKQSLENVYFMTPLILIFKFFVNFYFTHTMRKNQVYTPKTMDKKVLYAFYEKSLFSHSSEYY